MIDSTGLSPWDALKAQHAAIRSAGRTKRAAARAAGTPTRRADDSTPTPPRPAARSSVNLVSTAGQTPADGATSRVRLRDQRRRLREAIQRFTRLDGLRGCGAKLTGELVGLHIGSGAARFAGLQSCHSVWACPVCQARIRAARAVELERAALAWLKAGHGLYMATLTVPHWEHVRLASRVKAKHKCEGQRSCSCACKCPVLADGPGERRPKCKCACPVEPGQLAKVVEAWRGVQGGTWWVGRSVIRDGEPARWSREWESDLRMTRRQEHDGEGLPMGPATVWQEGFRERWGVAGTTRTIEITYGANGWHSHAHVLLWTEEPATEARATAIEEELFHRWAQRCVAVGLPKPARGEMRDGKRVGKGVDVAAAGSEKRGEQGDVLARYVVKLQEGSALAMEMTGANMKVARGQKGRTVMELAAIAATGDEDAKALWHEFEFATRGIQCLTWSHGLRERLALLVELDEREDEEIPDEETDGTPEAPTLLIARDAWWRAIVPVHGARSDILQAAEVGGLPGTFEVLDRLGLIRGVDYAPPATASGALLASFEQLQRGLDTREARRARRTAVDAVPLSRTPQQWAKAQAARVAAMDAVQTAIEAPADEEHMPSDRAAAHADFRARLRAVKASR
ncbi:hypothetical protein ABZ341_41680 [Streptomyces sp. NPDC006173]|uniref:hypothetical protein n=1 Tax=Streptomyces sp. NPDC006173 TaxID=3155349 RepID=UPI0033F8C392